MPSLHPLFKAVLKRAATKKSRNDLIHAEEGEDRLADLCAVGESLVLLVPGARGWTSACSCPGCCRCWGSFLPRACSRVACGAGCGCSGSAALWTEPGSKATDSERTSVH